MTTGREVKAQVREALEGVGRWAASIEEPTAAVEAGMREALAALAPCTVLTAEEAERVVGVMELLSHGIVTENVAKEWAACRVLLGGDDD